MRRIFLCAAVIFAAIQLSAAPVDFTTAQAKAQNFVQQKMYAGKLKAPLAGDVKLAHAEMNSQTLDRAVYYIFNTRNGYVIVSGDDRAEEILGYGDAPLNINNLPCNMKAWLGTYKVQIEYLQAHEGMQVEASINAPSRIPSVGPLLTALWDQEAPYWNQCVINGTQCLTGCPATSAAMVYYYWKYPDFMTPEVPAYRCELSTSSWGGSSYVNVAALPPVMFDWDNMLDSYSSNYTTAQGNAVATLMRYVGQAERMAYGSASVGSGIDADSVSLIVDAYKLFGYDEETIRMVKKTSAYSGGTTLYSDTEWAAMIQEELAEERPIVYCAIAGGFFGGGHAFNVDGYDATSNKYHVNFGWSGSSNNYYALNAFNGGGSVFNQYQQMVIGIQPPLSTPRLKTDANDLSMSCYKNQTATATFTLSGRNLEENVSLELNDENNVFSISDVTIERDTTNKVYKRVTVTYAPKAEGYYTASITCRTAGVEDIVISLKGRSDYELYRPVMQNPDEQYVTTNSFRADWTDNTPEENVLSYTLEVRVKPEVALLTEADWSNVPAEDTNHASDAANYLPEGWTFTGNYFYLDGGFVSSNRNCYFEPNCDLVGYNKISVIVVGKAYRTHTSSTIDVTTDVDSKTISLPRELDTCIVVLEVGDHANIRLTTGYYPEIQRILIYGGEITDPAPYVFNAPNESGDASYRLIEGITPDKFYTVNGLMPGTPYLYRVKSMYVNNTESGWSNSKEVLLLQGEGVRGDVDGDGKVNIDDITLLIDSMLNGSASELPNADVDLDGKVNIDDITLLIDYLLKGAW